MAKEKVTATEEVADAELSDAYDQGVLEKEAKEEKKPEEKVESEPKPEGKPPVEKPASAETAETEEDETLDHKESSRLGRKFKGLESRFGEVMAKLDQIATAKLPAEKQEQIEMPEVITTPEDVKKVIQAEKEELKQAQIQYEQEYLAEIGKLAKTSGESLHTEIIAEISANNFRNDFNNIIHGKPDIDAQINYANAKAHVFGKKIASSKPKVPQRETSEKAPIQPAASATHTAVKAFTLPKLDEAATSYVAYLKTRGMSDEDIAKEMVD